MDSPDTPTRVLGTPELLSLILAHLSPGELLRMQRVCRGWCSLITEAPDLCAATFSGPGPIQQFPKKTPQLNTFVINRLRWSPSLDLALVNTTQFQSVETNPTLQAMTYENASWRHQYLTWPPLSKLVVSHGCIAQEDSWLPKLVLTCHGSGRDQPVEDEEGEDGDSDSDDSYVDTRDRLVLSVEDFPHNSGQHCRGITVLDLIYGLRMHYLSYEDNLKFHLEPGFRAPSGGEILTLLYKAHKELELDVTVLNF